MVQDINNPEITVLLPVYNGEKYLKEAVESILQQSFTNFEFLIINDGSTDNSVTIIESFKDARIRLIHNRQNIGLVASLNKGIELAKGVYIARMDCDDVSYPERLKKEWNIFQSNSNIDVVATQMLLINSQGNKTGMWSVDTSIVSGGEIKHYLPRLCCIAHPSVMVKKSLMLEYLYNPEQKGAEDWDLWLRMASDGKVFYKINELLLKYRVHDTSVTIIRNKDGMYLNLWKVQIKFCLNKIRKLHFNAFDFRVLFTACSNYFRHVLFLISPALPAALPEILRTNIILVISQYLKIEFLKIPQETSLFLFMPYNKGNENDSRYAQVAKLLSKNKTLIFITNKNNQAKLEPNMVDISTVGSYPYLQKRVKKKIRKYISKSVNPVIAGYNSLFYYNLMDILDAKIKCIDIFDDNMNPADYDNKLIYNFGIWGMPYARRFSKRIVIGPETLEEMKNLYVSSKMDSELFDRMEYIANFRDLNDKLKEQD